MSDQQPLKVDILNFTNNSLTFTNVSILIAIVGGGIGGATAAYYLREIFKNRVSITLFEQSGRIGGRIKSMNFAGDHFEAGASIFHSSNMYMYNFAKQFGLPVRDFSKETSHSSFFGPDCKPVFSTFGVPSFLITFQMLWHYGMDLLRIGSYTKSLVKDFSKIYRLQDEGYCYTTPARLLSALRPEFVEMTTKPYGEWLSQRLKLHDGIRQELAYGLVSNNYCQDFDVHAFVGFISMATVVPKLYAVISGNEKIPQALVEHALKDNPPEASKQFIHASVKKIDHHQSGSGYQVTYDNHMTNKTENEYFDCVVLAAPMHQKTVISLPKDAQVNMTPYRAVDHSFVFGRLKHDVFGISQDSYKPSHFLSFLPTEFSYRNNKIAPIRSILSLPKDGQSDDTRTWVSFTEPDLMPKPEETIPECFINRPSKESPVEVVHWLAYPIYHPVSEPEKDLGSFNPAPGLYYVNAIEKAASCMETSAIGGRNVALLIAHQQQLGQTHRDENYSFRSIFSYFWK